MHAMRRTILTVWALTEYLMVLGSVWSAFMKVPMQGQLIPQGCTGLLGNQERLHNALKRRCGGLIVVYQRMTGMELGIR